MLKTRGDDYVELVLSYAGEAREDDLGLIEDIGAALVAAGVPIVEMAGLHERACRRLQEEGLLSGAPSSCVVTVLERASACLTQLMIAYSIADEKRIALLKREQRLNADHPRLESLGQVAGGICHEINNLLQPITGLAELIIEDEPAGSDASQHAELILECASRAASIVASILMTARRDLPKVAPVVFAPVVENAVTFLQAVLPPALVLELAVDCGMERVLCEPAELSQILLNLVRNAEHAIGGAGTVRIELSREDDRQDDGASRGFLRLAVRDNGTGMPPHLLARAFHPFFTTKAPGTGSGLGLSVVMAIAESWGATAHIDSEPNRGTRVSLRLPILAAAEEPAAAEG
jgi:signal transduction histidine kinase